MKSIGLFLFAAVTAITLSAQAQEVSVGLGQKVSLPENECGGTAELYRSSSGELRLEILGSRCAKFAYRSSADLRVFDVVTQMDGSGNSDRSMNVAIQDLGQGVVPVLVGSNGYIAANGLDKNKEGVQINIQLPQKVQTLPRNWTYELSQDLVDAFFGTGVCSLVDSSDNIVAEVSVDMCFEGSNLLPSNMVYDFAQGTNQCYIWWSGDDTRVSANAVSQEKCN
jgi:hypothetical protein